MHWMMAKASRTLQVEHAVRMGATAKKLDDMRNSIAAAIESRFSLTVGPCLKTLVEISQADTGEIFHTASVNHKKENTQAHHRGYHTATTRPKGAARQGHRLWDLREDAGELCCGRAIGGEPCVAIAVFVR